MSGSVDIVTLIAMMLGIGWASGLNLYALVLVLGLTGSAGYIDLPSDLLVLQHPMVIAVAGLMFFLEFIADKIPGVDTVWDAVHTFIRIPAGAILAASVVGEFDPVIQTVAALVGGSFAATTHAAKMGTRMLVNTSPEPFSNVGLSIGEDIAVIGGLLLMTQYPLLFLCLLLVFVVLLIWWLPKLWQGLKAVIHKVRSWFSPVDSARSADTHSQQIK